MLVTEGSERNGAIDRRLACYLAAIAGALNAAAFHAVGFFAANMTGNVSALSDHMATGEWLIGLFYLAILLVFIAGAFTSASAISAGRRRGLRGVYAYVILSEGALLAALGCADLWLLAKWRESTLVLGLAFLMGLQNAVVTRISGARIRTTHVSGMATDIGIELSVAVEGLRGLDGREHIAENRSKLSLHGYTVLSFLLGGIVGVILYQAVGAYLLIISGATLLSVAIGGILQSGRETPRGSAKPFMATTAE
jgi:uncharacterized membrane protein YoaK (UPF0700 family)